MDGRARFEEWLGVIFVLLLVGTVYSTMVAGLDFFSPEITFRASLSSCAGILALLGLCLISEVRWPANILPGERCGTARKGGFIFWTLTILVAVIYRILPLLSHQLPDGLVWEEHESAWGARQLSRGGPGSLMFSFSTHVIGSFFLLAGAGEFTYRMSAITLGFLSVLLFGGTCRVMFPSWVAISCLFAYATTPSLFGASVLGDEGWAIMQFVSSGALISIVLQADSPSLLRSLFSGVFFSLALYEYAPLKLVNLFIPVVFFTSLQKIRKERNRVILNIVVFCTSVLLIGGPMLKSIFSGGEEFFDGRRRMMVGEAVWETVCNQSSNLIVGLKNHFELVFVRGNQVQPLLNDGTQPGFPSLLSVWLVFLPCIFIFRKWYLSQGYNLTLAGCLIIWVFICFIGASMWHPFDATLHRMQVAYPLLIVLIGYVWAGMFELIHNLTKLGFKVVLPLIIVASNSSQIYFNLNNDHTKIWFRSRTNKLCEFFNSNPANLHSALRAGGNSC